LESEKRQKKIAQNAHRRKIMPMEAERDKQKAELEKSGVCITFYCYVLIQEVFE
jgi:hypothetical protein